MTGKPEEQNLAPLAIDGIDTPLISLEGVSRRYGRGPALVTALDNVSLSIAPGEFVAIVGPSGSGKSTCLNIIGCLDVPTSGSYRLKGIDVATLSGKDRALLRRQTIGFIFQGFHLLPRMTAIENVETPLLYRGVPRRQRRGLAEAALAAVGLDQRLGHTPNELSGGQQQRVAIARALVTEPDLLIADEPTGALDSSTSSEVMQVLRGLNQELGTTIVMVTHDADTAVVARRTIRFSDGRIAGRYGNETANHAA